MPDRAAHPIHFDGDWTKTEQALVENAIAECEKRHAGPPAGKSTGSTWICYCKRLPDMNAFMVHRLGWQRILCARSALDLALNITMYTQSEESSSA